jgi:hypothetical protein
MKRFVVLGALMAAAVAAPASAAIVFDMHGTFSDGGTLTGTFTTNDALTQVTAIDLFSSSNGAFQGFNYNNISAIDSDMAPYNFRLTLSPEAGHTDQLQLVFSSALTASGAMIGGNAWEHQDFQNSGNRSLTGTVTEHLATGAVPEPATWTFMIGGLGLVGAVLRRRRSAAAAAV